MPNRSFLLAVIVGAICVAPAAGIGVRSGGSNCGTAAGRRRSPAEYVAIVNKYCVTCHNERAKTGGLALDTIDFSDLARQRGRLGKSHPQSARRHDAAAGRGAARRGDARAAGRLAHRRDGSCGQRRAESGPAAAPPAQPGRVRQRRSRSARARRRSRHPAAARRLGVRVRQHRRRARDVSRAARTLHGRGGEGQRAGGRRSGRRPGERDVSHSAGRLAGRAHRRHADRNGRRHPRAGHAAARRRVHDHRADVPHQPRRHARPRVRARDRVHGRRPGGASLPDGRRSRFQGQPGQHDQGSAIRWTSAAACACGSRPVRT